MFSCCTLTGTNSATPEIRKLTWWWVRRRNCSDSWHVINDALQCRLQCSAAVAELKNCLENSTHTTQPNINCWHGRPQDLFLRGIEATLHRHLSVFVRYPPVPQLWIPRFGHVTLAWYSVISTVDFHEKNHLRTNHSLLICKEGGTATALTR